MAWTRRNADHRTQQAAAYATARGDRERLAAAFAWFRASVNLQARRRPPLGVPQDVHRQAAARLTRDATAYLKGLAEAIDRGDYDAQKVTSSDNRR
jgi:hypothetical protein